MARILTKDEFNQAKTWKLAASNPGSATQPPQGEMFYADVPEGRFTIKQPSCNSRGSDLIDQPLFEE